MSETTLDRVRRLAKGRGESGEKVVRELEEQIARKDEREKIRQFVRSCIDARLEWAQSEDGRRVLGPGSPTVPGLQEYYTILAYLDYRDGKHASSR